MTLEEPIPLPNDFRFNPNPNKWQPTKKLISRTGYFLCINEDGLVYSSIEHVDCNALLQFETVDTGIVTIKGVQSGRYLAFNSKGVLCGVPTKDESCSFHERMKSLYTLYKSEKYSKKKWFLAISKRGRIKNGRKSRTRKKHSQFLPIKDM
ncbi:fibroblast growth factor 1 [Octopus sinensis]|uniref:Fibroblast growth factor n=1 Tax=Octopus sinensis TaxID=2607531 RepID=A0A6P7T9B5_9MOLL|nr:fibroblast growth factor 1 [Octopus sinensis]